MDSTTEKRQQYIHSIVMQEQAFFWQRFEAFAALHAGLFVLATSTSVTGLTVDVWFRRTGAIYVAGTLLALIWMYVQYISLYYVDRLKPLFHEMRSELGLEYQRHWLFSRVPVSSTDAGALVSLIVAAVWSILLFLGSTG